MLMTAYSDFIVIIKIFAMERITHKNSPLYIIGNFKM